MHETYILSTVEVMWLWHVRLVWSLIFCTCFLVCVKWWMSEVFVSETQIQNGRKLLFPDLSSECTAYDHRPSCLRLWRQRQECSCALPVISTVCLGDDFKAVYKVYYLYLFVIFLSLCFPEMKKQIMTLKADQNNCGQEFKIAVCITKHTPNERHRLFVFHLLQNTIFIWKDISWSKASPVSD